MRVLSILIAFFLLPTLGHAEGLQRPELKKVTITEDIRTRLDVVEKRVGDDFPIAALPETTKTLEEAYKLLLAKKQKQVREALDLVFKDAETIYAVEFALGQGDSRRTVFVFSQTVDFKKMVYAYSPVKKGERWMVNVIGK